MAKGIIYVMTTVVPGLIKIGKTGSANFDSRMYQLERHGYSNVVGLKRYFAIEVDDYDDKELLLQDIFSKSKLENSELFALDIDMVVQLLSSFEGKQIFPKDTTKDEMFDEAVDSSKAKHCIPDGEYYFDRSIKRWGGKHAKGKLRVKEGRLTLLKGAILCPISDGGHMAKAAEKRRAEAYIVDGILQEEIDFSSPSGAGGFLTYAATDGWLDWKTKDGQPIDIFRKQ